MGDQVNIGYDATTTSSPDDNFVEKKLRHDLEFWLCTGFSAPLAVGALYLCIAQIVFCFYKSKRETASGGKYHSDTSKNSQDKHAFALNMMSAFAATCAFLRAGIDFRLTFGKETDLGCDLSIKFKLINYLLALLNIYLVLWVRQRIFYQHPRLRHLSSKLIRGVSWAMSAAIVTGVVTIAVFFFAVGQYLGTPYGCVAQEGPYNSIRWFILIGCTTLFQICLLSLFVYPLVKHKSTLDVAVTDAQKDFIIPLIKRAAVTSFLCVVSDIGFAMLILFMRRKIVTMSTFVYDVNIVFNTVCLVMSFPDWKLRLLPWRLRARLIKRDAAESNADSESQTQKTGSTFS